MTDPIQDAVGLRIKLLDVGKEINRPRLGISKVALREACET